MNKEIAKTNFWTWFSVHKTELEAFIVDENRDYTIYDELTEEEHKQINHRLIALKRLTKRIESLIL